jgi:hypothetical protein
MLALYGKVEEDRDGHLQIIQPQFEVLGDINEEGGADEAEKKAAASLEIGRIVPIYESTGQGKLIAALVSPDHPLDAGKSQSRFARSHPAAKVRAHLNLATVREALWKVHWPDAGESFTDLQSSAHRRPYKDDLRRIVLYRTRARTQAARAEGANRSRLSAQ